MLNPIKKAIIGSLVLFVVLYAMSTIVIFCSFKIKKLNMYQKLIYQRIEQIETLKSIPTREV